MLCGPARADRLVFPNSFGSEGSIEVLYRLDRPAAGRGTLDIEWTDVLGRVVAQLHIPVTLAGGSQIRFPLDLDRAVTAENRLLARLSLDHGKTTGKADASFIVPPKGDPWSDFRIIMWQPQTPAGWAALKRLGITAGTVLSNREAEPNEFVRRQIAVPLDAGLRWYLENLATDFYSSYHKWSGNKPVNWRFLELKRRYQDDPGDASVFIREPSLSDPSWLGRIRRRVAANVRAFEAYRPLFYNLADEPGIADLSAFWDFDFSTYSLSAMREWLEHRYGSLAQLNEEWGTSFQGWNEVVPQTTDEATQRSDGNFAAWADFKEWMDVAFARAIEAGASAIHAVDPKAIAAIEGAQIPGWGGYDYSRLATAVDAMELYDHGENVELARSFNPGAILLTTSFRSGPAEAHRVWRELLRGTRGLILWDSKHEFVDEKGKIGERGREAESYFREIGGGLGALLINSERRYDPIAILYSPASWRIEWLLDHGWEAWSRRSASAEYQDDPVRAAVRRYVQALEHMGLEPRFVSAEQVESGALQRDRYRALILPQTIALSAKAAAQIRSFVGDGRTVLAEGEPGIFDEHGRKRAHPVLADLFTQPAPGSGAAIRLAAPALDNCGARRELARILAAAGVRPAFPLTRSNGEPAGDVETYLFENGGVHIVALLRDAAAAACGAARAETGDGESAVLELSRPYEIYDVRARRTLGRHSQITVRLGPVEPTILALSERPLAAPAISGPTRARLGDKVAFRISLAGTTAARDVIHFSVIDPSGRPVPYYSANLVSRDGTAAAVLPLSVNDRTGIWHLRATEVLSGAAAWTNLVVAPAADAETPTGFTRWK